MWISEDQHETKVPEPGSWAQRGYNTVASGSEDKPPLPREIGLTVPIWTTPPADAPPADTAAATKE